MRDKSRQSEPKQAKDCSMSSPTSLEGGLQTRPYSFPLFATVESAVTSKKTTSKDKSLICDTADATLRDRSTQTQKSCETLGADLTSKGRGCAPYWTDLCEEIGSKLLLPVETDSHGLDSSLFNTWQNKTVEKSWFSTHLNTVPNPNWCKIFLPSSMCSLVASTDCESTVRKSKKIRIYLDAQQRKKVRQWIGTARYVYNRTVEYLQLDGTKANWKNIKGGILNNLPDWSKSIPYQIKSIAIRDACIAVREAKNKYKETGVIQKVKFRSRKNPVQSCYIPSSAVNTKGIYRTILGEISYTEKLPEQFGDGRLVVHQGCYYLCLATEEQPEKPENQGRLVALDPGVRNFLTFFSENSFGWIGAKDIGRIQRLCTHLDDLISCSTKAKSKQRRRMRKAANRIRLKIRHLVDELHHKVARFLVDNFDVILLPTFEVSQMVVKSSRKIRAKSVRQMLCWSHYRFEGFLKPKAKEAGKLVLDVNEAYTSKTVSWTGEIISNLGGRKVIKGSDGLKMDRDLNGARGIFLRALVDTPSLRDCLRVHC